MGWLHGSGVHDSGRLGQEIRLEGRAISEADWWLGPVCSLGEGGFLSSDDIEDCDRDLLAQLEGLLHRKWCLDD